MAEGTAATSPLPAQVKKFALAAGVLTLGFLWPLVKLVRFAISDDLHSYIPLMPFIAGYLAWPRLKKLSAPNGPALIATIFFGIAAAAALAEYISLVRSGAALENALAASTLAWVLAMVATGCWFLGAAEMRKVAFPFFLLIFTVPLPIAVRDEIEMLLQHGSAVVADWMFTLAGMVFSRDGMVFRMPGITVEVAPECSGIHSTWVLLITSLIAGHMILRRPWKRAVLCLAVIPLALLRNGFRILVIGELCVHVGPHMINSPIHRHGGPLFFVLSLVPFFLLLFFLKKSEATGAVGQRPKSDD